VIGWFSSETPDRHGGGGQRRQYHQIRSLVGSGIPVEVVTLDGPQSDGSISAIAPVTRFRWTRFDRVLGRSLDLERLFRARSHTAAIVAHVESVPHFQRHFRRLGLPWLVDFHNVNWRWHAALGEPDMASEWAAKEKEAALAASLTTVCSAEEADALLTVAPDATVALAGHGVDPTEWPDSAVASDREAVAVMVGVWTHRPNAEGAMWMATGVWPKVRSRLPDARLVLAGPGSPPEACLSVQGISHVGRVDDLPAFLGAAAVTVVPIRRGIGARMKFGEALASGTPVVSTSVGAEGFAAEGLYLRADDEPSFADACLRLLTRPHEARELGAAARAFALERLVWPVTNRPMIDWVGSLL
jgi:glycosyltransferase involved in cell wall biosynthesis